MSTLVSRSSSGEPAADLVAVELGQVAVEDDDVVGDDARLDQRGCAVVGDVDGHALAAQAAGDGAGQPAFVFGDEHSHVRVQDDGCFLKRRLSVALKLMLDLTARLIAS